MKVMASYICYSKNDNKKEVIMKTNAKTLDQAFQYFASIKQLPIDKFSKLFNVEQNKQ